MQEIINTNKLYLIFFTIFVSNKNIMTDLTYTQNGFFTRFIPNTKEGEEAFKEIYRVTGDGAVRNDHLKSTLKQLRRAGYKVSKAKKSKETLDDILNDDIFNELLG